MPLQRPRPPENLSDAELQKRLAATAENPGRLGSFYNKAAPAFAVIGIIGAVFLATALGSTGIGEIALVMLVAAGLVTARALTVSRQEKWDRENFELRVEQNDRPARGNRALHLAQSLKEKFIKAMTEGTEEKVTVKQSLRLKKPKP
jgi:hypothetical protein